jgi:hypothetical protein
MDAVRQVEETLVTYLGTVREFFWFCSGDVMW